MQQEVSCLRAVLLLLACAGLLVFRLTSVLRGQLLRTLALRSRQLVLRLPACRFSQVTLTSAARESIVFVGNVFLHPTPPLVWFVLSFKRASLLEPILKALAPAAEQVGGQRWPVGLAQPPQLPAPPVLLPGGTFPGRVMRGRLEWLP